MKIELNKRSPAPGFMYEFDTQEITLTRAPANRQSFLLTKSTGEQLTMDEILEILKNAQIEDVDELEKALEDADVDEDGIEAAKAIATIKSAYSDEVTDEVLAKALGLDLESDSDTDTDTNDNDTVNKNDDTPDNFELPADVQKRLDRVDELEKRVESLTEDSRRDVWAAKVDELEFVSVDKNNLVDTLVSVESDVGKDAAEKILETHRSADEMVSKASDENVFKEYGSSAPGRGGNDDYETLKAKAREIAKEEDISHSRALMKARRENPDLLPES